MTMTPIRKTSISEQVFDQLKNAVISGEWQPGTRIPSESVLAEQFGVSRVTVRQALQKLTVLGLIETRTGEGSFVQTERLGGMFKVAITPSAYLKKHTLQEVMDFRRCIEIQTAGLAAKYATDKQLIEMKNIYEKQTNITENTTVESFAQDDLSFHMAIARCTNNSLIETVYEVLWDILMNAMQQTVSKLGFDYAKKYHGLLLESISNHDIEQSERIMKEHLDANEAALCQNSNT